MTLLPATDDALRTWVDTPAGSFPFQEWFVARQHRDEVDRVRFDGEATATPAPGVLDALAAAELIVIAPSNPFISIWPILAVAEIRAALERRRVTCVAVSPIVGGRALKGPADRMLERLAGGTEPRRVATCYQGLVDVLVIDRADAAAQPRWRPTASAASSPTPSCATMRAGARSPRRCWPLPELRVIPVEGLPEIVEGDDLGELIVEKIELVDADVVVVSQKVVSKAEGRIVRLDDVEPSAAAIELAGGHDARHLEVILSEAARIVRSRPPLVIAETRHGFVCASAGVDASNAPEPGTLVLLPVDPDASAAAIREQHRRANRPRRRRHRQRLVRPAVSHRHRRRRDRRGGHRAPRRLARPGRSRGARAPLDGDRRRRRDRLGGGARHGQARGRAGGGRPRARGARPRARRASS